jgi:hypothetical protein
MPRVVRGSVRPGRSDKWRRASDCCTRRRRRPARPSPPLTRSRSPETSADRTGMSKLIAITPKMAKAIEDYRFANRLKARGRSDPLANRGGAERPKALGTVPWQRSRWREQNAHHHQDRRPTREKAGPSGRTCGAAEQRGTDQGVARAGRRAIAHVRQTAIARRRAAEGKPAHPAARRIAADHDKPDLACRRAGALEGPRRCLPPRGWRCRACGDCDRRAGLPGADQRTGLMA